MAARNRVGRRHRVVSLLVALATALGSTLTLLYATAPTPALGATYTVTTFTDDPAATCGVEELCSLRNAVERANADSGDDTIVLAAGVYTLSVADPSATEDDTAEFGDLDVFDAADAGTLTIVGAGRGTTVIEVQAFEGVTMRAFEVLAGGDLTIDGASIKFGSAPAGEDGGLIANHGTLALTEVEISHGTANNGGGVANFGEMTLTDAHLIFNVATNAGGGIFHNSAQDAISWDQLYVAENVAGGPDGGGGALVNNTGAVATSMTISNSVFEFNTADTGPGAGVRSIGLNLSVLATDVDDNEASGDEGGGISAEAGVIEDALTLILDEASRVRDNWAAGFGGGVRASIPLLIDGLIETPSDDVIVSGNFAAQGGGGIYLVAGGDISGADISYNGWDFIGFSDYSNDGGGILAEAGLVTITISAITGNQADGGAGISVAGSAELVVSASEVRSNYSFGDGGGISATSSGPLTIENGSTVTDNSADSNGGGVYADTDVFVTTNSIVAGNQAQSGGGIFMDCCGADLLTVTDSTIGGTGGGGEFEGEGEGEGEFGPSYFGNSAWSEGGGIYLQDDVDLDLTFSHVVGNDAGSRGGGVYTLSSGDHVIADATIEDNAADLGGAIYFDDPDTVDIHSTDIWNNSAGTDGGGLYIVFSDLTWVRESSIRDNSAFGGEGSGGAGGGVFVDGTALFEDMDISSNTAFGDGGGIHAAGEVTVRRSTISDNTAVDGDGGGIFSDNADLLVENSTISGNTATAIIGSGKGAGVYARGSEATNPTVLVNSTVAFNSADLGGGGIWVDDGEEAGEADLRLANTIVSDNAAPFDPQCAGLVRTLGHNLIENDGAAPTVCGLTDGVAGDLVGASGAPRLAELGPLAPNVPGLTLTHALLEGSDALEAGNTSLAYPAVTPASAIQRNGSAIVEVGGALRLTNALNQGGSAFWTQPVDLTSNFETTFEFDITELTPFTPDASADGITFAVVGSPSVLGERGRGIGIGLVSGSVAVEVDTYTNNELADPNGNHIGIRVAGSNTTVATQTVPGAFDDGARWTMTVSYDAGSNTLTASVTNGTHSGQTSHVVNIPGIVGPTGYLGFTSGTGSGKAAHRIHDWTLAVDGVCLLDEDQRGEPRPQGECDIGAYEAEGTAVAFAFDFGTGEGSSTDPGVVAAELAGLPPSLLQTNASTAPAIAGAPVGSIPVGSIPVGSIPVGSIPVGSIPVGSIPVGSIPVGSIPVGSIGAIVFEVYDTILLTDIPIVGGWTDRLPASLQGLPLQVITFGDFLRAGGDLSDVSLAASGLQASPVGSIPVGSIATSGIDIGKLGLPGPSTATGDFARNIENWCAALAGSSVDCATLGVDPLDESSDDNVTPFTLTIAGAPVGSIPVGSIPVGSIPVGSIGDIVQFPVGSIPVGSIPVGSIVVGDAPVGSIPVGSIGTLGALPVGSIPVGSIDVANTPVGSIVGPLDTLFICDDPAAFDCADPTATVGDAFAAGKINPDATLSDLSAAGAWGSTTLADLLVALINAGLMGPGQPLEGLLLENILAVLMGPTAVPWSLLDYTVTPLQPYATVGGTTEYEATIDVSGAGGGADISVDVELPTGATYLVGTGAIGEVPVEPTIGGVPLDEVLTFDLVLDDGSHTLTFSAGNPVGLGPTSASASASWGSEELGSPPVPTATNVAESPIMEPNNSPATATPIGPDALYFGHLAGRDRDFYSIDLSFGQTLRAILANVPDDADFELVLIGPDDTSLPDVPNRPVNIIPASDVDYTNKDDVANPARLGDVLTSLEAATGLTTLAVAARPGQRDEELRFGPVPVAGTYYLVAVPYQRRVSPLPYTLQVQVIDPIVPLGSCLTPAWAEPGHAATGASTLTPGANVLFVTNDRILGRIHGGAGLADLNAALAPFIGNGLEDLGVIGARLALDEDPAFNAAYDTWLADFCDVSLANLVATQAHTQLDAYLDSPAGADIEYVVVVGDDTALPYSRIPDGVEIAQEKEYLGKFGATHTPQTAALAANFYLSDHPLTANFTLGNKVWVPTKPTARLGESISDMTTSLQHFIDYDGTLDPETFTSNATVFGGADFLDDGAQEVAANLGKVGGRTVASEIGTLWTDSDLVTGLGASELRIASILAHADHDAFLSDVDDANGTLTDLFTVGEVPTLSENLVAFTAGCHALYSPSDVAFGFTPIATDFSQAFSAQNAPLFGGSSFNYGDTVFVDYTERVMANFADNLDGSKTLGESAFAAGLDYLAGKPELSEYDVKAFNVLTLAGLPFYAIGGGATGPSPAPPPVPQPTGIPGLSSASLSFGPHTFTPEEGSGRGTFYPGPDGDVLSLDGRPALPTASTIVDVPGLVATDALITGITDTIVDDFDPVIGTAEITASSSSRARPEYVLPGIFPNDFLRVGQQVGPDGIVDVLTAVLGKFIPSNPPTTPTTGKLVLFNGLQVEQFFKIAGVPLDSTPPTIEQALVIDLETQLGTPTLAATVIIAEEDEAEVVRVVGACRGNAVWHFFDLVSTGAGRWTATLQVPSGADPRVCFFQAVNMDGFVGISDDKDFGFGPRPAPPLPDDGTPLPLDVTPDPDAGTWYSSNPTLTLLPDGVDKQYSLNGAGFVPYTGPFPVTGDGVHILIVRTADGQQAFSIPVDTTPPVASSTLDGKAFTTGSVIQYQFACSDAASGVASGSATAGGSPISNGDPAPSTPGTHQFEVSCTDNVGLSSNATFSYTVVDPPTITVTPSVPVPIGTTVSLTAEYSETVNSALIFWGDGTPAEPATVDGSGSIVTGEHVYTVAGLYSPLVIASGPQAATSVSHDFVVVFDGDQSTHGNGKAASAAGSDLLNPELVGELKIGHNLKYKKNSGIPEGKVRLTFEADVPGDGKDSPHKVWEVKEIDDGMSWMVINGAVARFVGLGTLEAKAKKGAEVVIAEGEVRFEIRAIDGDVSATDSFPADAYSVILTSVETGEVIFSTGPDPVPLDEGKIKHKDKSPNQMS